MLLDDGVGDGQPEARALADLLRREERVEDLALGLLGHARPVVADLERDGVALFVVPRPDDQGAAAVRRHHRLFGVDHEVEQHLLDLVRVGEDLAAAPTASAVTTSMLVTRCS